MGAWGTRIYEDDFCLDVRADYLEDLANSISPAEAEEQLLKDVEEAYDNNTHLNDLAILSLGCAQLETATLTPSIKQKVLEVIDSGRDADYWREETDAEEAGLRKRELTLVRKYVTTYKGEKVRRKSWIDLQRADKGSEHVRSSREPDMLYDSETMWSLVVYPFWKSFAITLVIAAPFFIVLFEIMKQHPIRFVWFGGVFLFVWMQILIRASDAALAGDKPITKK